MRAQLLLETKEKSGTLWELGLGSWTTQERRSGSCKLTLVSMCDGKETRTLSYRCKPKYVGAVKALLKCSGEGFLPRPAPVFVIFC